MPTDPASYRGDGVATEAPDDDLTFAVQDLGRERVGQSAPRDRGPVDAPPAPVAPVVNAPAGDPVAAPPPASDGFVIREPAAGAAPSAPVDALVVGTPEPAAEPDAAPHGLDSFRISSTTATGAATPGELWTTRNPRPEPAAEAVAASRRGWSTRHSEAVDRSAQATMLRLREEAVNVSWKSAWIAVTQCDPRLLRRRAGELS